MNFKLIVNDKPTLCYIILNLNLAQMFPISLDHLTPLLEYAHGKSN